MNQRIVQAPQAGSYLLLFANCAIFALCASTAQTISFGSEAMLGWGAVTNNTLANHEYWRLLAAAFLHFNLIHLAMNMICLMSWGGTLERRIGTSYFLMIYLAAAIGGNIVSVATHHMPFAGAGASGGVWGIVGALVCLQILGKPELSLPSLIQILVINIALNAAQTANIDWRAHFGGFTAGLIVCAVLEVVARFNRVWLSAKFPEFVKLNLTLALPAAIWLGWNAWPGLAGLSVPAIGLALVVAVVIVVKIFDVLLTRKKGLAFAVAVLAAVNLVLVCALAEDGLPLSAGICGSSGDGQSVAVFQLCSHLAYVPPALGLLAAVVTVILLWIHLRRGLTDVGFIRERFRTERIRASGL